MRKVYAAITAATMGVGLVFIPLTATAVPLLRPTPPPGTTIYAPRLADYPVVNAPPTKANWDSWAEQNAGGWVKRGAGPLQAGAMTIRSTGNPLAESGRAIRTTDFTIDDPIRTQGNSLAIPIRQVIASAKGSNQGARIELRAGVGQSAIYCSAGSTDYPTTLGSLVEFPGTLRGSWSAAPFNVDAAQSVTYTSVDMMFGNCTSGRVSAMVAVFATFDASGAETLHRFEWSAETAAGKPVPYINADPIERICQGDVGLDRPECLPYRTDFDPVDFERVCAGAPTPEWLSFAWLGATIGHYATCLFRPLGGWDDDGVLASTLNGSALVQAGGSVTAAVEAFRVAPQCGQLITAPPDSPLGGFTMSTCDWNSWAGLLRDALFWLVTVGVTLWAIRYFLDGLESILDRKGTSPVSTASAS